MRTKNLELRIKNEELRIMRCDSKFLILFCVFASLWLIGASAQAGEAEIRQAMKGSLVYLEISSYGYDQYRPWRNTDVMQKGGVGCAKRESEEQAGDECTHGIAPQ